MCIPSESTKSMNPKHLDLPVVLSFLIVTKLISPYFLKCSIKSSSTVSIVRPPINIYKRMNKGTGVEGENTNCVLKYFSFCCWLWSYTRCFIFCHFDREWNRKLEEWDSLRNRIEKDVKSKNNHDYLAIWKDMFRYFPCIVYMVSEVDSDWWFWIVVFDVDIEKYVG